MVTKNDILSKIKGLRKVESSLTQEDKEILSLMESVLKGYSTEEDFKEAYERNTNNLQDLVDLFYEYYGLLVETMPKEVRAEIDSKGKSESKFSAEELKAKKIKLAKARAAALLLLKAAKK